MVSLLLIISFLLHIVLMMAVYYLHQQLQLTRQSREREIESLFANFLQDIKRENELLQNQLVDREQKERENTHFVYNPPQETKVTNTKTENENIHANHIAPLRVDKEDKVETSMTSQIFQLSKEGLSTEEIAKTLHRGKTEVELILKLQHKNVQNS